MTDEPPERRYGFYLAEPKLLSEFTPPPPAEEPLPGTGTVYLVEIGDGEWDASWQADERHVEFTGSYEDALAWALKCPAKKRLRSDRAHGPDVPF